LERCFVGKLQAVVTIGARHTRYEFFDDGILVASTVLSHGWRPSTAISARMVSVIQRELRLQGQSRLFEELVRCPCTRERWLEVIRQS
jgi:hypothetical protein